MNLRIDNDYVTSMLEQLVRIDSTNPALSSENAGEAAIATFIADQLRQLGLSVTVTDAAPQRPNVVGILQGSGGGRSLMLNGHTDTVGVEGMAAPFAAEVREGRMYGRGTQDMKGSLAAMMGTAKALSGGAANLRGDVLFAFVVDEETKSIGTASLVEQFWTDAAIVTEPTDMAISRAHRGFIWYDVQTFGRAAHGSRYQEGVDAITRMGRFLARLDNLEKDLRGRQPHPLVGPPSLHASKIAGGTEISIYAAHCLLQIERRTVPGEHEPEATAELQAILEVLSAEDETFRADLKPIFVRNPFEVDTDAGIVQTLEAAAAKHLGEQPAHRGETFWTDAALLAEAGIETVLMGPKGAGLHSALEWVDLQSVLDLSQILTDTAVTYCS